MIYIISFTLCILAIIISLFNPMIGFYIGGFLFLWSYWLLFDIGLNCIRNLPFQYIDRKSVMDQPLRKYSKGQIILCKLLVFLLLLTIYKLLK